MMNFIFKKSSAPLFICLALKQKFSKMPHYRQMAKKLNITIPKLNDELQIKSEQKCVVYGIREISPQHFINEDKLQEKDEKNNKRKQEKYFDQTNLIGFQLDKHSREIIQFDLAKRIATNLNLDICLMKQAQTEMQQQQKDANQQEQDNYAGNVVISLTRFRQYVYREYYLKQLKNKSKRKYIETELTNQCLLDKSQHNPNKAGSQKNRIKSIRIGEDLQSNDMKNKKNQVERWLQQGQRTIKIIANNNSDKSFKAIQKFCSLFQKQVEIQEQKIQPDPKKKPVIRLYAILQFQHQIQVDFDFINKRWRRREAEIKLNSEGIKKKSNIFNVDFTIQDSEIQKAYLAAFQQSGIPYPKQYSFLTDLDRRLQKQGVMSLVKQVSQQIQRKKQQEGFNQYEDQPLTEKQKIQRDKENRKILEIRTVQDIIEEMDELKSRSYQMEHYESTRYKQLEKQLKEILKNTKLRAEKAQS